MSSVYSGIQTCSCGASAAPDRPAPPCTCPSCAGGRSQPVRRQREVRPSPVRQDRYGKACALPMPFGAHANGIAAQALPQPFNPPSSIPVIICCENGEASADSITILATVTQSDSYNMCQAGIFEIDASAADIDLTLLPPTGCTRNNAHFKRIDSNPFTVVRIIAGSGEIGNMLSISLSACNSFGASTGESALLYWNGSRFEIL